VLCGCFVVPLTLHPPPPGGREEEGASPSEGRKKRSEPLQGEEVPAAPATRSVGSFLKGE